MIPCEQRTQGSGGTRLMKPELAMRHMFCDMDSFPEKRSVWSHLIKCEQFSPLVSLFTGTIHSVYWMEQAFIWDTSPIVVCRAQALDEIVCFLWSQCLISDLIFSTAFLLDDLISRIPSLPLDVDMEVLNYQFLNSSLNESELMARVRYLAWCCMMISTKMENNHPPSISVILTASNLTKDQLFAGERDILRLVGFCVSSPTPLLFMREILDVYGCHVADEEQHRPHDRRIRYLTAMFIQTLAVLNPLIVMCHLPSTLAVSGLILAEEVMKDRQLSDGRNADRVNSNFEKNMNKLKETTEKKLKISWDQVLISANDLRLAASSNLSRAWSINYIFHQRFFEDIWGRVSSAASRLSWHEIHVTAEGAASPANSENKNIDVDMDGDSDPFELYHKVKSGASTEIFKRVLRRRPVPASTATSSAPYLSPPRHVPVQVSSSSSYASITSNLENISPTYIDYLNSNTSPNRRAVEDEQNNTKSVNKPSKLTHIKNRNTLDETKRILRPSSRASVENIEKHPLVDEYSGHKTLINGDIKHNIFNNSAHSTDMDGRSVSKWFSNLKTSTTTIINANLQDQGDKNKNTITSLKSTETNTDFYDSASLGHKQNPLFQDMSTSYSYQLIPSKVDSIEDIEETNLNISTDLCKNEFQNYKYHAHKRPHSFSNPSEKLLLNRILAPSQSLSLPKNNSGTLLFENNLQSLFEQSMSNNSSSLRRRFSATGGPLSDFRNNNHVEKKKDTVTTIFPSIAQHTGEFIKSPIIRCSLSQHVSHIKLSPMQSAEAHNEFEIIPSNKSNRLTIDGHTTNLLHSPSIRRHKNSLAVGDMRDLPINRDLNSFMQVKAPRLSTTGGVGSPKTAMFPPPITERIENEDKANTLHLTKESLNSNFSSDWVPTSHLFNWVEGVSVSSRERVWER